MCVNLESCYHDFVTLFAGRYRNYNNVVVWSVSIDIFETFVYVMLRDSNYLKTLYWCFWYFRKRRETVSVVKWHLFLRWHTIVFEFSAAVKRCHYYRRFWILQKYQILECFFETHNPFDRKQSKLLQAKYAKLEMKVQLVVFLEKYHVLRNFAWIGKPFSVLS